MSGTQREPSVITKQTTFILGAGASLPYGFPLGNGLVNQILTNNEVQIQLHRTESFSKDEVAEFLDSLDGCQLLTIDRWLAKNPRMRSIGRAAIAAAIIHCERHARLAPQERDVDRWFPVLWDTMQHSVDRCLDIRNNAVGFITYNYDRSLEAMLFRAIRNTFTADSAPDHHQAFAKFPIIHIHGQVAPFLDGHADTFGKLDGRFHIARGAECISVPCEVDDGCDALSRAKDLLLVSDRVVFLGYGYHQESLQALNLWRIQELRKFGIAGTGIGLTEGKYTYLRQFGFRPEDANCSMLLRDLLNPP